MKKQNDCPCYDCERALACNWTCDALNAWAGDKSFAEIAEAFIDAYKAAKKEQYGRRRKRA